jgi:hypothetical protein
MPNQVVRGILLALAVAAWLRFAEYPTTRNLRTAIVATFRV